MVRRSALGALIGLTWAAALRAYMAEIVGYSSEFHWLGTFVGILLPGVITGAALGGRRQWARIACGTVAAIVVAGVVASVPGINPDDLALGTARGTWVMVLVASLMVTLVLASSIPFRRLGTVG